MVLWLTGAPGLVEEVADELWDLLPGARVVDPGALDVTLAGRRGADGLAVLEQSPGWRALRATVAAELAAWRSERLVVPRPVLDLPLWEVVEAGLLRAGLDAVLVALDVDEEVERERVRGARVAVAARCRQLDEVVASRAWFALRADVVVPSTGLAAQDVAATVASALDLSAPPARR